MMQFRNIIGIAGGAVFFAASAFAEISVKTVSPVSVPVEQDCPLSGEVDAGYFITRPIFFLDGRTGMVY